VCRSSDPDLAGILAVAAPHSATGARPNLASALSRPVPNRAIFDLVMDLLR
jgi:hypothetical protein